MTGSFKRGRAENTWYLRVELPRSADGARRQRRETVRGTKKDAERRLRDLVREIETGGYAEGGRHTVAVMAKDWLSAVEHRVGARAHANYSSHVNHYIVPALGSLRAEMMRPAHVERALASWLSGTNRRRTLATPISARTVRHVFATLRSLCAWGVRMGILVRDPSLAVEPPKVEQREMRALDPAGVADLEAVRGTEMEHPVALAIGTGLRLGEILGLRWSDVDFESSRLSVRRSVENVKGVTRTKAPKTARSARTIALPSFVADVLRRRRAEQLECLKMLCDDLEARRRQEDASIFTRADNSPWKPHVFSVVFYRAVQKANLQHVRFHDLRHTFGTLALAAGVDLKTVSSALGHSTISVTANVYLHAVESLKEDAASRIDGLLGKAVGDGLTRAPKKALGATTVPRLRPKA